MRILIGADTYAPDVNGASYFAQRLAAGLAGRGHDVRVVCPSRTLRAADRPDAPPGRGRITEHRVASLPVPRPTGFRVAAPGRLAERMRRLLARVRPDVVHVQSHVILSRALVVAAQDLGIPVIATTHMVPDNLAPYIPLPPRALDRARAWFWRAAVDVLARADVVTAPTPYAARLAESHGVPGPVLPVSNGLDLTRFRPDRDPTAFRARHGLDSGRPVVGYLGRLHDEKHVDEIVTAFAELRRTVDAQLLVVGDGERAPSLGTLTRTLGIEADAVLTGALADDEIPDAYAAMDVFVNAGTAELQSLVTLEAMATARPVVAVDAGALPHLVDHGGNGFLYRHGDPSELAGHVRTLLADPDLAGRAGQRSLEMVGHHTLDGTLETFETLYADAHRTALGRGRRPRAGVGRAGLAPVRPSR